MEDPAVEKTAEDLRREIEELHRQQREITERLRDPRGLRRGGIMGPNPRNMGPGVVRPMGRGMLQRGVIRQADSFDSEDQPPTKKRLLSTVVKVEDEQTEKAVEDKKEEVVVKVKNEPEVENDQVNGRQPILQRNASGRMDNRRGNRNFMAPDAQPVEPLPRILSKEEDPSLAKRNRRMFGTLLGTLEKFRKEDKQLSGSEAFLRRSSSLKRAEQRAQEESERLRQQEREQLAEKRRRDLTLRARLAAKAEEKQLELLFIQWTEHQSKLCEFLRTRAEPHIFYVPAKPLENLEKILESQKKDLAEWKSKRRQELSDYQKQINEEHLASVEAEIERWQAGANRRNAANVGIENFENEEGGNGSGRGIHHLKGRTSGEEDDVDEDVEDMADDDIVENVLEEEVIRKNQTCERDLKGVVEYVSGDDEINER